jgi:hypothetical protein
MDVLSASVNDDKIAWYENINGSGSFGPQQIISTSATYAESIFVADIDSDGDADVLSASPGDSKIAWYENTDGTGTFGAQQVISTAASWAKAVFAADIDGDGDIDALSASYVDDKIAWYENTDGAGAFGPPQVISTMADGAWAVFSADLDRDGDADVLSASHLDNKIAWYENTDGAGSFGPQRTISTDASSARSVFAADLDGDNVVDAVSASNYDDKIAWYKNGDGVGDACDNCQDVANIGQEDGDSDGHGDDCDGCPADPDKIDPGQCGCGIPDVDTDSDATVDCLDTCLDGDGDGYGAAGGAGNTCTAADCDDTEPTCNADCTTDADSDTTIDCLDTCLDGDGDGYGSAGGAGNTCTDVDCDDSASTCTTDCTTDTDSDATIDCLDTCLDADGDGYGSGGGAGNSCTAADCDDTEATCSTDCTTDTDSDSAPDCSDNCPAVANASQADGDSDDVGDLCDNCPATWNSDQANSDIGEFGQQETISTAAAGASSVFGADIDGDGDIDVLSASASDNKIAWYENTDGSGTFGSQQVISTSASYAQSIFAADIDSDGDIDVLSASLVDDKIAWYENTNGSGSFGTQQVISTAADYARSVFAADVDGDGDLDVLSASYTDDKIAWYENTDGNGTFGSQLVISTAADGAWSVFACDIDSDGDMDVLSASHFDHKIAWYENTDGSGTFGSQQVISTNALNARSVRAADIDGDGAIDVVSASNSDDKIAWYQNTDGQGSFGSQQVISTAANGAYAVFTADIDGDGDTDVLSASSIDDKIAWYENIDGGGTFGPQQVISTSADGANSVFAADLNGDGNVDALSTSIYDDKTAWYMNGDEFGDDCDNCPYDSNPGQEDSDSDGTGDACEP